MSKLVQGIGINGNKYPSFEGGKVSKEYNLWISMLHRCTEKFWTKNPAYIGVTCSDNFRNYTFFYEWCQLQVGFKSKDEKEKYWQLDKDLLLHDNNVYSEDTCIFIPQRINKLFTKNNATRGEWPIGVSWDKQTEMFKAYCNNHSRRLKYLGYFHSAQEAFQAYKTFKEALIKQVADEYKTQLDIRVYEALMNYEVSEND